MNRLPEVPVPRQLTPGRLGRETLRERLTRSGGPGRPGAPGVRPRLRSTAAMCTTMSALAATSMVSVPSAAGPFSTAPCALTRTTAHHSEGLDTWNAAYPRPARSLDAVMVFLSFPDSQPLTTPAELAADHFPATSRFFEQASYGRFTLRPHPLRRWFRMPRPSTEYAVRRDWTVAHRSAYLRDALSVVDRHVDFSRYDIVYLVADPDAPGVDSDATKVVNLDRPLRADGTDIRRVVTVFENHPPDRLVLAHETGHVFDLPDLYHRPVDGKGDWDTHVGDWDLMGSQFALAPDLFGWHKWKLGWLEPRQVRCVQDAGPVRLTLEPLGAGAGTPVTGAAGAPSFGLGRGTKLAVVRTGPDSVIALEARGPVGNDTEVCRQGVLVYRVSSDTRSGRGPIEVVDAHPRTGACAGDSVYPPLADAPVALGESFTVPGESVRVEVEGRTASGAWTVRISTG
ncbi:M6 family metalloprotease domain-containing protein [Streptomyces sp. NPDC126497]|uniref:M6 family metalloprotease domain-containing protein n=1 Tax=Streptomyces sp. NPDC126497 TaxID=3155313 RepID=UPI00331B74B5